MGRIAPVAYGLLAAGGLTGVIAIGFASGWLANFSDKGGLAAVIRSLLLLPLPVLALTMAHANPDWRSASRPLLVATVGLSSFFLPGAVIALLALTLALMIRNMPWLHGDTTQPAYGQHSHLPLIFGLIVAGCTLRLLSLNEPFERDLMVYSMVASGWLEGLQLYRDIWDHKPPALYLVYAAAIAAFGQSPWAIFALNCVFFAITLLGVHRAAGYFAGPRAALFATVIWAVCGSDLIVQANQPNVEVFMNACLVWALALLLAHPETPPRWPSTVLAGLLFFAASTFKQIAVFPAIFIAIALMLNHRPTGAGLLRGLLNPGLTRGVAMGMIGAAGWAIVFDTFYANGTFADFYHAVFTYNQQYSGSMFISIARGFWIKPLAIYFFVFMFFGACHLFQYKTSKHLVMAAAYAGTLLMFMLPGKYFPHYYQLMLPLIAVTGGWVLSQAFPKASVMTASILMLAPIWVMFGFMTSPERIAFVKYGRAGHGGEAFESKQIGLWLSQNDYDMSRVLHWGAEPGIYFWSGHPTQYKYVFNYPLLQGSQSVDMSKEFVAQVSCALPDLIVVKDVPQDFQAGPVWNFLNEYYSKDISLPTYELFTFWRPISNRPACP
jgi:hypothetical protein